jgi:outer membrane lipoprotein-sorting protein
MSKTICVFLVCTFLFQSNLILADEKVSAILQGVRKKYGQLAGLSINYKREIITRSMAMLGEAGEADLATGQFYFKPPNFFKVLQETPRPEIVTTDGTTLWWYIPHKGQVYRYPAKELGRELRLLSDIFHGLREVEEGFGVSLVGYNDKGEHQLKLVPNPPWPEIHHVNLSIAQQDHTIRVVEIHNALGDVTRFLLGDLSVQDKLREEFFRFVVPEGVKIIEEEG